MRTFENQARNQGFSLIAGTDEAGRGPLAGPVVSAAVLLPPAFCDPRITDSKKLSPKKREEVYEVIRHHAVSIGIAVLDAEEIDRINILQASLKSMKMAVDRLKPQPDYLLVDGKFSIPSCPLPQLPLIKGDAKSISVAAASVIAKVERDRIMLHYHGKYPDYGFSRHKGYPTPAHKKAIAAFGPCPIHRRSFKGVKEYVR